MCVVGCWCLCDARYEVDAFLGANTELRICIDKKHCKSWDATSLQLVQEVRAKKLEAIIA